MACTVTALAMDLAHITAHTVLALAQVHTVRTAR